MKLSLFVLILSISVFLFIVGCTAVVQLQSIPPVDEIDTSPLPEGCNNNGKVDLDTEECDDGNNVKNDQCHQCKKTFCGDQSYNNNPSNYAKVNEQCDNIDPVIGRLQCGNTTGVNATCNPYDCKCYVEETILPPICGDGVRQGGWFFGVFGLEQCDANNQGIADAQCIALGLAKPCDLKTCMCANKCNNDGIVDPGEACDDGNANSRDACTPNCQPTRCGDGLLNDQAANAAGLKEECEIGSPCANGKTCDKCKCSDDIIIDEPRTSCGNKRIEAGEQCDPPGSSAGCDTGMKCNSVCRCEPVERVITPRCGDGYISSPDKPGGGSEDCDIGGGYGGLVYPAAPDTCKDGKKCVKCKCVEEVIDEVIEEDPCTGADYYSLSSCESQCDGECSAIVQGRCYKCNEQEITEVIVEQQSCPSGTERNSCSSCSSGHCVTVARLADETQCKQCIQCPSNAPYSTQQNCASSCQGNCVVGYTVQSASGSFNCYRCEPVIPCEDRCASLQMQVGTGPDPDSILSWLESNARCKDGASLQLRSRNYPDGCYCYSYSVSVGGDLFCRGTPCGDVPCDSSTSCGSDPTITVTCSWGGWRWLGGQTYQSRAGAE